MKRIISSNFAVNIDDSMGEFLRCRTATLSGERYEICYRRKSKGYADRPEIVTVATFRRKDVRDDIFHDLQVYLINKDEKVFSLVGDRL